LDDNRPFEALDLAVRHKPRSVPSLLRRAGKSLWARGNPGKLYALFSQLSEALREDEKVQLWRLASALELGKEAEVLAEVERFLDHHKAPEVRALYASAKLRLGDPEGCLREAQCAAHAEATPLTLLHYGFSLGTSDPERGLDYLRKALRLAERRGEDHWASLAAASLAGCLTALGHYQEAADYGAWGHKLGQDGHVGTRLYLLNEWAFARILRGDVINLEETLRRELGHLESAGFLSVKAYHNLALLFRGTLADLLLATGQAEEAVRIYEGLWSANRRREVLGGIANCYVRGLLELGAYEQALSVAGQALCLTEDLPLIYHRRALLAHGLALSMTRPDEAYGILEKAAQLFADPLLAPRLAQARLYLAWVRIQQGRQEEAGQVLAEPGVCWDEFGEDGLRYLLGPEHTFQEVMAMLQGEAAPLELHFLQKPQVRYQGQVLPLGRRLAELLAVLALHPEGLNLEQLALAVYGETPNVSACKTGLSRLRELVPLEAHPYRLRVGVKADFLELPQLLKAGRVREAMALYQCPLLARSQSPVITEERDFLEEALRQAAMKAADPEALLTLAKGLKDDLAIWEATLHALPEYDPR
jgi:tetratricopeptide (TPR) repeat protein